MLEIRITAPEISEAINNLARAIGLAVTNPGGTTIGAVPSNTTAVHVNEQTEPPETTANLTAPVSAPQNVPVAQNTENVSYSAPTDIAAAPPLKHLTIPTAAPQYTLEMIAKAGTALVDAGKTAEVSALLARYGVEVLTALDPSMYGAIAMDLRAMGAQI